MFIINGSRDLSALDHHVQQIVRNLSDPPVRNAVARSAEAYHAGALQRGVAAIKAQAQSAPPNATGKDFATVLREKVAILREQRSVTRRPRATRQTRTASATGAESDNKSFADRLCEKAEARRIQLSATLSPRAKLQARSASPRRAGDEQDQSFAANLRRKADALRQRLRA